MITRKLKLTLLEPGGSLRSESLSAEEFDRSVMTSLIRKWVVAAPNSLEHLYVIWNGSPRPAFASSAPPNSAAEFNPMATAAHSAYLKTRDDHPSGWSPEGGKVYGPILIIEDSGLMTHSQPARTSDELATHGWFQSSPDANWIDAYLEKINRVHRSFEIERAGRAPFEAQAACPVCGSGTLHYWYREPLIGHIKCTTPGCLLWNL